MTVLRRSFWRDGLFPAAPYLFNTVKLLIESLRASRRAVLFSLFAWKIAGLLSLHLSVCPFVASCAHFGSMGGILGVLGASWVPFWELWGSLGHHFGVSGDLAGFILGARRIS